MKKIKLFLGGPLGLFEDANLELGYPCVSRNCGGGAAGGGGEIGRKGAKALEKMWLGLPTEQEVLCVRAKQAGCAHERENLGAS